ncbi:hypothetical protein JXA34_03420, partial [Patescibacteria group bacterium]|nr:hypothetical protein [Patescibacteria group bacterium]
GSQLGVWWEFAPPPPPKEYKVFLPYIAGPPPTPPAPMYEDRTINEHYGLQIVTASWTDPTPQYEQPTCLRVTFSGDSNAKVESGWFFGGEIYGSMNGVDIDIPHYTREREDAVQIDSFNLAKPATLTICTVGTGGPTEIGLRVRYPH